MKVLIRCAALGALLVVGGCGEATETKDGLTAKERGDLDNAAAMLENQTVFDTSADSMVPVNDSDPILPPANSAAPAPPPPATNQSNSTAPR